jgi:hypothetical protein
VLVFDVLTAKCPVGDRGAAQASCRRGEMKIVSHARVRRGELHYDSQYESEL